MSLLTTLVDFILHVDEHLAEIITRYGVLTYAILFAIVFCETGLVVTPFLPGDSLLFAAGAFAAKGSLHPFLLFAVLSIAAVVGDTVNYAIGHYLGKKVFTKNYRFLNREHLTSTEKFYEKHGGKTIIFARFMPIIRTLAPFVAGAGKMSYTEFFLYNVLGGVVWVGLFVYAGFFFGTIPAVEHNFTLVIFAIIGISLLPPVVHALKGHLRKRRSLR